MKRVTLAEYSPELAAEWHPTKNGELKPKDIAAGSNKKVWWLGKCGHEWESKVGNRFYLKRGCPICSRQSVLVGFNDLATTHPDLAAEWHPTQNGNLTPSYVMTGSKKRVWWLGKCGHEWEAVIYSRSGGGKTGCPICAGQRVLLGFNDLATTHPRLAAEWHPTKNGTLTPRNVASGSKKKVWWMCQKGHEWQTFITNRSNLNSNCPVYTGETQTSFPEQAILFYLKKVTTAENRYTDLGKEIDVWLPDLRAGIEYNGPWHQNKEEADAKKVEFFAEQNIRILTVKEGSENRIDGDTIEYVYSPNKDSLNWAITSLFQILQISPPHVDAEADSFEIFTQYIILEKENSLAVKYPEIAAEWHPTKNNLLTVQMVSPGSQKKVWWLCPEGHEYQAIVNNRSKGKGCPVCAGKAVLAGFNDLATVNPNIAAEWHPTRNGELTPQIVTPRASKKVWWKCKEGHEWQSIIENRARGTGCPYCSGRYAIPGLTDLATVHPEIAAQWHPTKNGVLLPYHVTKASSKKVWWQCEKGHEWQAYISNRIRWSNCPICSRERENNHE